MQMHPHISQSQSLKIAQNYLNSQGLPYTANSAELKTKVKVIATGEIKWEDFEIVKQDFAEEPIHFEIIVTGWAVQIADQNGKNVGTIYVNSETGEIIEINIPGTSVQLKTTGIPLIWLGLALLTILAGTIFFKKNNSFIFFK